MKAPFFVPTRTRTELMRYSFQLVVIWRTAMMDESNPGVKIGFPISSAGVSRAIRTTDVFRRGVTGVRVHDVSRAVTVVIANPCHVMLQAVFIPAIAAEIEIHVRAA